MTFQIRDYTNTDVIERITIPATKLDDARVTWADHVDFIGMDRIASGSDTVVVRSELHHVHDDRTTSIIDAHEWSAE